MFKPVPRLKSPPVDLEGQGSSDSSSSTIRPKAPPQNTGGTSGPSSGLPPLREASPPRSDEFYPPESSKDAPPRPPNTARPSFAQLLAEHNLPELDDDDHSSGSSSSESELNSDVELPETSSPRIIAAEEAPEANAPRVVSAADVLRDARLQLGIRVHRDGDDESSDDEASYHDASDHDSSDQESSHSDDSDHDGSDQDSSNGDGSDGDASDGDASDDHASNGNGSNKDADGDGEARPPDEFDYYSSDDDDETRSYKEARKEARRMKAPEQLADIPEEAPPAYSPSNESPPRYASPSSSVDEVIERDPETDKLNAAQIHARGVSDAELEKILSSGLKRLSETGLNGAEHQGDPAWSYTHLRAARLCLATEEGSGDTLKVQTMNDLLSITRGGPQHIGPPLAITMVRPISKKAFFPVFARKLEPPKLPPLSEYDPLGAKLKQTTWPIKNPPKSVPALMLPRGYMAAIVKRLGAFPYLPSSAVSAKPESSAYQIEHGNHSEKAQLDANGKVEAVTAPVDLRTVRGSSDLICRKRNGPTREVQPTRTRGPIRAEVLETWKVVDEYRTRIAIESGSLSTCTALLPVAILMISSQPSPHRGRFQEKVH